MYGANFPALYKEKFMKIARNANALAAVALLTVLAASASTAARAGDVYWSVGVSVPGVQVGVSGPQPVYVPAQPYYGQVQPVYTQPQVIYTQPQVVYTQPQVIYTQPSPVYVQPRPVVVIRPPVYVQPQPVVVYDGWQRPHRHPHHGGHQGAPRQVQYVTPAAHHGNQGAYPQAPDYDYGRRSDRG